MGRRLLLSAIIIIGACASPPRQVDEGLEQGSFTAELNGFDIHYEVHGNGPVLMTVPNSWGLSLQGLRSLFRPLEEFATVVYFDPRGMGGSSPGHTEADLGPTAVRADFHALREHLRLERVHAIGWSNGASNLMLLASEHPEAIDRAIFLHGTASFDEDDVRLMVESFPELFREFGRFQEEMETSELSDEERAARVKQFDTEVWFPYLFTDRDAGRARLPELYRDTEFSWAHMQATNREWAAFDARERLADITANSLVITGRHDMTPPSKGEEIAEGIPDARHELFENSAHFAPLEEPQKFVGLVRSFLAP